MAAYAPAADPSAPSKPSDSPLEAWIANAKARLAKGELRADELDAVRSLVPRPGSKLRQRLLYLHAVTPNIGARLVGAALHEPVAGGVARVDPTVPELPYKSVHDALKDGWQIVHFPQQMAPFDDQEIDILGFEFILQKMEPFDG